MNYIFSATRLLKSMNLSVNPCDDFYQFACGSWVNHNPVPPTESHRNQFDLVMEKVDNELKGEISLIILSHFLNSLHKPEGNP